ncbi:MAG: retropepsin-like aspartic protease [Povalibacter sp.]
MIANARPTLLKLFLLAGLIGVSVPGSLLNATSTAVSQPQSQTIKLERFRKALWTVQVVLNGKSGNFLFDTGGGQTLVTPAFAAGLNCKFWGRTTGYNMFGKEEASPHCDDITVKAGDVELTPVSIGTHDFGDQFPGDKAPDGILSLDAFDGKIVTLDQQARTLTIESATTLAQRIKNMQQVPVRISRECSARCLSVFLGAKTPQGLTWLVLDSGAGGVSLIAKEYAQAFGLNPDQKDQHLKTSIAPGIEVDSPVIVTDMIMDGNLGQPFLARHLLTLDLAEERLWLAPQQ